MSKQPQLKVHPASPLGPMDVAGQFVTAREVRDAKLTYLLPGRLVQGAFCLLEGDPNSGKSVFLSHLAAMVSTGKPWMGRKKCKPAGVLWLTPEEDPGAHIRPRLKACGANIDRVHFCAAGSDGMPKGMQLPQHFHLLQLAIAHFNLQLVIMDPLVSHLAIPDGLNQEGPVRTLLDQLQRLACGTGCTMLGIRQWKKERSGPRITWGMGSVAIAATARAVVHIDWPDTTSERRVMRTVKCIGGGRVAAHEYELAYKDGIPVMTAGKPLDASEDDLNDATWDAGERDMRDDARKLLKEALKDEPKSARDVIAEAAAAGIGERTLRKAKADLKITSERIGDTSPPSWLWSLPTGEG